MFKRMVFAIALIFALSAPAMAEVNGVYGGLKFLDSIQSTGATSHSKNFLKRETDIYSEQS